MAFPYVGRFAPSPTGSLHLGSLVAAVGSHVDARSHQGRWLVRIEDLDSPRVLPGCADEILRTLERFGLAWDGPVEYQSRRTDLYRAALETLRARGLIYECSCSRRVLAGMDEGGYPGTCRQGPTRTGPTATRFRVDDAASASFEDRFQGPCGDELHSIGDFVVRRRDGILAYQLAVVVDDFHQNVTDVVRGADLLGSTAWQIALQRALGYPTPRYGHLPLVVEPDGGKLSKSRRSVAVDTGRPAALLVAVLRLLQQNPPSELAQGTPAEVLAWAAGNWSVDRLRGLREVPADRL